MTKNTFKFNNQNVLVHDDLYSGQYFILSNLHKKLLVIDKNVYECLSQYIPNLLSIKPEVVERLKEFNIIESLYKDNENNKPYEPLKVIFLPTNNCNLRCIYCYASAGERNRNQTLNFAAVKKAIDIITDNAAKKKKKIIITLHGGGEPFVAFELIKKIVNHAKKTAAQKNVTIKKISISTNGVMNDEKRSWTIKNLTEIQISMDGLETLQNKQRPAANKLINTFEEVMKTIKYFDDNKFPFKIKTTLSSTSACDLTEFVKYIHQKTKCRKIHFEIISPFGRNEVSDIEEPDYIKMLDYWMTAQEYAYNNNFELFSSEYSVNYEKSDFCGINNDNFIVTYEGLVTTCFKSSTMDDPMAETFVIGKYDEINDCFHLVDKKINKIRNLKYQHPDCEKCAALKLCQNQCTANYLINYGEDESKISDSYCLTRLSAVKWQLAKMYSDQLLRERLGYNLIRMWD